MRKLLLLGVAVLTCAGTAYGTAYFLDTTGDHLYSNNANWDLQTGKNTWVDIQGDPAIGAIVDEGGSGPTATTPDMNNLSVGYDGATARVQIVDGGRLRPKNAYIGTNFTGGPGVGTVDLTGTGKLVVRRVSGVGSLNIGHEWGTNDGGTGTLNVHDAASVLQVNNGAPTELGANAGTGALALGTLNLMDGLAAIGTGHVKLGLDANSTGIINVEAGLLDHANTTNNAFSVGINGAGELNISGGNVNLAGRLNLSWDPATASDAAGTGIVRLDGGALTIADIYIDPADYGTGNALLELAQGANMYLPDTKAGRIGVYINQGNVRASDGGLVLTEDLGNGFIRVYTPEPAAVVMLALGGLWLRRRR